MLLLGYIVFHILCGLIAAWLCWKEEVEKIAQRIKSEKLSKNDAEKQISVPEVIGALFISGPVGLVLMLSVIITKIIESKISNFKLQTLDQIYKQKTEDEQIKLYEQKIEEELRQTKNQSHQNYIIKTDFETITIPKNKCSIIENKME